MIKIISINNDEEYNEALLQVDEHFHSDCNTELGKYINNLIDIIVEYEEKICPENKMFICNDVAHEAETHA